MNPHPCKKCCPKRAEFKRIAKEHAVQQLALSRIIPVKYHRQIQEIMNERKHGKKNN